MADSLTLTREGGPTVSLIEGGDRDAMVTVENETAVDMTIDDFRWLVVVAGPAVLSQIPRPPLVPERARPKAPDGQG